MLPLQIIQAVAVVFGIKAIATEIIDKAAPSHRERERKTPW